MLSAPIRRLLSSLVLLPLAGACGPSTAPEPGQPFDAQAALADYDAVAGLLAFADLAALRALEGRTPLTATGGSTAPPSGELAATAPAAPGPPAALAPLIAGAHRGKTFVYDPVTDRWVVDPARAGAPATGVRFVLYETDAHGRPILVAEIGWVDVIDEGDASAEDVVLRLRVVTRGVTRLDYRTALDVGLNWSRLGVLGFLRGTSAARLDFDVRMEGRRSLGRTVQSVEFDLGISARDFRITGSVQGVEEGTGSNRGTGALRVHVGHGRRTLELDATLAHGRIEGRVLLGGELFATLSGDAHAPTVVSARGDPLGPAETLVLFRVLDTIEDVFDFVEDLVDPVGGLVLLGLVLS